MLCNIMLQCIKSLHAVTTHCLDLKHETVHSANKLHLFWLYKKSCFQNKPNFNLSLSNIISWFFLENFDIRSLDYYNYVQSQQKNIMYQWSIKYAEKGHVTYLCIS